MILPANHPSQFHRRSYEVLTAVCFPGQIQVLSPHEPVRAAPGEDAVLKCLVDPKFDIGGKTVEWSKLDLKVNPADPSYVYLYRNRREDVLLMFPSYVGRTKLFTEALKDGNILLLIKNVTLADNGQYRCFIPDLKSTSRQSTVTLHIINRVGTGV
uniref:Ig-like domain-containing protein n=1 Tax=Sphaeramia orbicularis TaxID=375764 RepID=A0A673BCS6_9TELE